MAFGEALNLYRTQLEGNPALKPASKPYRQNCIEALLKSWPGLGERARSGNPAMRVRKVKVVAKTLHLPAHEQFNGFVAATASAGAWCSRDCADLISFLAYGEFRKGEATCIT